LETQRRELFGHPFALSVLAGTEIWERVSYYGFQAILVLYMAKVLYTPGHVSGIWGFEAFRAFLDPQHHNPAPQALASLTFGLYGAAATATPLLLGAPVGDLILGRRRTIMLGACLLTAGHFCMAFDQSFLVALCLLASGAGLMRGNIAPQIGALYEPSDRRRETAFQLYGAVINLGGTVGPLLTGTLYGTLGWHAAFVSAGIGMLIGLVWFAFGQRHLPPEPREASKTVAAREPFDWRAAAFLIAIAPIISLFWVAQAQIWNTYPIWATDHVELQLGAFRFPVPWLQAIDSGLPFATLPPMLWLWDQQARRGGEPRLFTKLAIGCFLFGAGTLVLAASPWVVDSRGRTPIPFIFIFHLVSNLGWLYFAPTVTTVYSRIAPVAAAAALIATSQLAVSLGQFLTGQLGRYYEQMTPDRFWLIHAGIVAGGGVLLLLAGILASRWFPTLDAAQRS
jgi:proton-dependent oligopeptide transporter, POT family